MVNAAAIYGLHVHEIREQATKMANAVYDMWLSTDMSSIDRNAAIDGIAVWEAHAIEGERELYRLNVAHPERWGCAMAA